MQGMRLPVLQPHLSKSKRSRDVQECAWTTPVCGSAPQPYAHCRRAPQPVPPTCSMPLMPQSVQNAVMVLLAPKARLTAAVAIRPRPSSNRADTAVLTTPAHA